MFEDSGEIYMITNKKNKKKYIGQAVCFLSNGRKWGTEKRWKTHLYQADNNKCECRLLENAIRKYGSGEFDITVLIECGIHELNDLEDSYIKEIGTLFPNGYNLMTGGGNGRIHSIESKKMMSITRTGKIHTQQTKNKISESQKGKVVGLETRVKTSSSSRYRNMKPEHKQTIEKLLLENNIEHLPIYINYRYDKNRKEEGFEVRVPKKQRKTFMSKKNNLTQKLKYAIHYKQTQTQTQKLEPTVVGLRGAIPNEGLRYSLVPI
jgi:group I intron endonuclease